MFCRYGSLSFGEVVSFVPQKLDKVKITSVRRLAIREAVKVCSCFCVYILIVFPLELLKHCLLLCNS